MTLRSTSQARNVGAIMESDLSFKQPHQDKTGLLTISKMQQESKGSSKRDIEKLAHASITMSLQDLDGTGPLGSSGTGLLTVLRTRTKQDETAFSLNAPRL